MRWILLHIACIALAVAAVSCGETHYDSRLAAIDSIIESSPDSALALLRAMPRGSITRGDDRAYHALLITEARYKCYESIPSTDTIDLAVGHFASSGDRLKLTRALIYKGAVLEELGNPTEAMRLYKQAEETALPSDYHSLGYVNLRMACLYRDLYAQSELHIMKYKKAYEYFSKNNDIKGQLTCLNFIGPLYRASNIDSSLFYIRKLIAKAKEYNNKESEILGYAYLARTYEKAEMYNEEKGAALFAFTNGADYLREAQYFNHTCYDLCNAYLKIGNIDSALYYFNKATISNQHTDNITRILTESEIERTKGNSKIALELKLKAKKIADEEINKYLRQEAFNVENSVQEAQIKEASNKISVIYRVLIALILIFGTIIVVIIWNNKLKINTFRTQMEQTELDSVLKIESHLKNEELLNNSVAAYLNKAKTLMEYYHLYENTPNVLYTKFTKLVNDASDREQFWTALHTYVNYNYDGLIEKLSKEYPNLTNSDKNFICLSLCGFSNILICIYMGYKNPKYVYSKKTQITTKMNISLKFDDFFIKKQDL